jgi:hypothetical protein
MIILSSHALASKLGPLRPLPVQSPFVYLATIVPMREWRNEGPDK